MRSHLKTAKSPQPSFAPVQSGVLQRRTDQSIPPTPAPPVLHEAFNLPIQSESLSIGLPLALKSGIEALSGISMDTVNVHYHSSQPAKLNALAYTWGRDIHLAPGQEQHLPHEAWHVVQQAQGRVKPTLQLKGGVSVNDSQGLEHEADVMGAKALAGRAAGYGSAPPEGKSRQDEKEPLNALTFPERGDRSTPSSLRSLSSVEPVIQRYAVLGPNKIFGVQPQKRPWFGYPYAVATGGSLVAQTHNPAATGIHDFLNAPGSNTAETAGAANGFSLRVSNDNQMAVEDSNLTHRQPKVFFATQQVVNASNLALTKAGSAFSLQSDAGTTVKILTGWWSDVTLRKVTPVYNGGSADLAPQNCNAIAAQITGQNPQGLASKGGQLTEEISKQLAPRAAVEYSKANDKYKKEYQLELNEKQMSELQSQEADEMSGLTNEIAKEYVANRNSRQIARLHANQYAAPDVGQSYMISSLGFGQDLGGGRARLHDYETNTDRDLGWGYHFGGVVARSGSDRITLENYARGDNRANTPDPRWYFQMYGIARGQSFHEANKATLSYANPLTVAYSKPKE
jgi:Domain of unknown function (DUF4157)